MQVCEEAVKVLKNSKRKSVRAILYVHGDGLRVVDDETKGLIVDQTIEKVSFCAPDRNFDRGFSYICRDGTTRRWMCHGFMAVGESVRRKRKKKPPFVFVFKHQTTSTHFGHISYPSLSSVTLAKFASKPYCKEESLAPLLLIFSFLFPNDVIVLPPLSS